jgi:uncharacterized protein YgbK (DUF1537 family)
MTASQDILIGWYGDDFTGSAAVMEVLTFAGVPSVLFLEAPNADMIARFPEAQAIGIASTARSQSPEWMRTHVTPAFKFLESTGAKIVHYKTCSTLDSAPDVGSIGMAIDIGVEVFGPDPVPFIVAAPEMRRYQAFGHLFASAGENVFRLDRHPVMSRHPVTPMDESDVARHLGKQTQKQVGMLSIEDLERNPIAAWTRTTEAGAEVVTLDAMHAGHMAVNGSLIWEGAQRFVAGSQGVEYALIAHWQETGTLAAHFRTEGIAACDQLFVVSGSVSPMTDDQITWAEENGFIIFDFDPVWVIEADIHQNAFSAFQEAVFDATNAGRDVVVCSARGPDDPSVHAMYQAAARAGLDLAEANQRIGKALGRLLERAVKHHGIRRAIVSGGDTSGFATEHLGIFAFTALAPAVAGAPILTAHSEDPKIDGLEIVLKGGQMGNADFFGFVKQGGGAT